MLVLFKKKKTLTQISNWATAKLPMVHAKCSGVRRSLGPTVVLTWWVLANARTWTIAFIFELQTESTSCWPNGIVLLQGGRNSLCSYLDRIHRSWKRWKNLIIEYQIIVNGDHTYFITDHDSQWLNFFINVFFLYYICHMRHLEDGYSNK